MKLSQEAARVWIAGKPLSPHQTKPNAEPFGGAAVASAFGFVWCGLKGFPAIHTRAAVSRADGPLDRPLADRPLDLPDRDQTGLAAGVTHHRDRQRTEAVHEDRGRRQRADLGLANRRGVPGA